MGTKRAGKGKHLFFYFTCLLTLLIFIPGCQHFPKKWQGEQHLTKAKVLTTNGEYDAALREINMVLMQFSQNLADQALYQMGLIYAHPENPNQENQKSLASFLKVVNEFPESSLRNEAQIWVLIVRQILDKEKQILDKEKKLGVLNNKIALLKKMVKAQKETIESLQDQNKEKKLGVLNNKIALLKKMVKAQKETIESLQDQIEKLKHIDLGIEEEKRKVLPQSEGLEEKRDGKDSGS